MVPPRRWLRDGVTLLLAAGALATAGWLYVRFGSEHLRRLASAEMGLHVDLDTFWRSAAALWAGADIYQTGATYPNLNPPFATVIFAPLGLLEPGSAYRLWSLCTVVLVIGSVIAVAGRLRIPAGWAIGVAVAVLASAPMLGTIALGQTYGVLTALLTLCWLADRGGRPMLAGIALGLGVALKPLLLLLLLLPLVRRQWPLLGAAAVSTVVASAVGVAVAGWSSVPGWLGVLSGTGADPYIGNASVPGTVLRLFSKNGEVAPLVTLPGALAAGYLLSAVVLGVTLSRVRHRPERDDADLGLWAMTAAVLLASPIAWQNYLVLLAPATLVVLAGGRRAQALLMLAPLMIGMEWIALWPPDLPGSAVPLSLYFVILLGYWLVLLPRTGPPARPPADAGRAPAEPEQISARAAALSG